jgi:hypothetical protein
MKRNLIFLLITLVYLSLMYICYVDFEIVALINMLFMTLMYIALFIAMYLIDYDKIK